MTQEEAETLWHQKWVFPVDDNPWKIDVKPYIVTCILMDWGANGETKFAIMAHDYQIGVQNPQWFTFDFPKDETEKLLKNFYLLDPQP